MLFVAFVFNFVSYLPSYPAGLFALPGGVVKAFACGSSTSDSGRPLAVNISTNNGVNWAGGNAPFNGGQWAGTGGIRENSFTRNVIGGSGVTASFPEMVWGATPIGMYPSGSRTVTYRPTPDYDPYDEFPPGMVILPFPLADSGGSFAGCLGTPSPQLPCIRLSNGRLLIGGTGPAVLFASGSGLTPIEEQHERSEHIFFPIVKSDDDGVSWAFAGNITEPNGDHTLNPPTGQQGISAYFVSDFADLGGGEVWAFGGAHYWDADEVPLSTSLTVPLKCIWRSTDGGASFDITNLFVTDTPENGRGTDPDTFVYYAASGAATPTSVVMGAAQGGWTHFPYPGWPGQRIHFPGVHKIYRYTGSWSAIQTQNDQYGMSENAVVGGHSDTAINVPTTVAYIGGNSVLAGCMAAYSTPTGVKVFPKLWASTDNGGSWNEITNNIPGWSVASSGFANAGVSTLLRLSGAAGRVIMGMRGTSPSTSGSAFRFSQDFGNSWEPCVMVNRNRYYHSSDHIFVPKIVQTSNGNLVAMVSNINGGGTTLWCAVGNTAPPDISDAIRCPVGQFSWTKVATAPKG